MSRTIKTLLLTLLSLYVTSCAWIEGNERANHASYCNQIKNRILLNGTAYNLNMTTFNDVRIQQQQAELSKLNATYRQQGCDN